MPAAYKPGPCHDGCVPVEPPPSPWAFPPADSGDGDLVAVGADLEPGHRSWPPTAAGCSRWPWTGAELAMAWWSPERAGRAAALGAAGDQVAAPVRAPVRDPGGHRLRGGRRRAVPTRDAPAAGSTATSSRRTPSCTGWAGRTRSRPGATDELAGGLYGVAIAGLFAGESMFTRARDASKVALMGLVDLLSDEYADRAACSTPSGRPRTWRRSGWWRCRGRSTCGASTSAPAPAAATPSRSSRAAQTTRGRPRRRSPSAGRRRPSRSSRRRG